MQPTDNSDLAWAIVGDWRDDTGLPGAEELRSGPKPSLWSQDAAVTDAAAVGSIGVGGVGGVGETVGSVGNSVGGGVGSVGNSVGGGVGDGVGG